MSVFSKKITAYLPPDMISAVKIEAAQKGNMRYSDLITSKINDAFYEFEGIKSYSDLLGKKKYSSLLASFIPSKIARSHSK